ncbi:MAG: hypothetical protein U1E26_06395 [Coriobacteriia bacterium]|nr:hypothetical protein [Coriobacteriia bacterium]
MGHDSPDASGFVLFKLHDYRINAFCPGDRRSGELLDRLHASPGRAARFASTLLRAAPPSGRVLAAIRPVPKACREGYQELLKALGEFLDHDVVAYASTLNEDVSWSITAVQQRSQTVFVTARTYGRQALADQARFLEDLHRHRPAGIVAPEAFAIGESVGRWTMLALTDVASVGGNGEHSIDELLPFLAELRALSEREVGYTEAIAALDACFGEGTDGARDLLARAVEGSPDARLTLCRAHGDFVPWNMQLRGDQLWLWDWNRAMDSAPWPFDAIHYCFQSRRHRDGETPEQALRGTEEDLARLAERLGVSGSETEVRRTLMVYTAYRLANEHRIENVGDDTRWLAAHVGK